MAYRSFEVQIEDCKFLNGRTYILNENYNSTHGSLAQLEYERTKDTIQDQVLIQVCKIINEKEYIFNSPSYSSNEDDLRIRIVFFKSLLVWYNESKPEDYYFEMKQH